MNAADRQKLIDRAATFKPGDRVEDTNVPGRVFIVLADGPDRPGYAPSFVWVECVTDPTAGWRNRVGETYQTRADQIYPVDGQPAGQVEALDGEIEVTSISSGRVEIDLYTGTVRNFELGPAGEREALGGQSVLPQEHKPTVFHISNHFPTHVGSVHEGAERSSRKFAGKADHTVTNDDLEVVAHTVDVNLHERKRVVLEDWWRGGSNEEHECDALAFRDASEGPTGPNFGGCRDLEGSQVLVGHDQVSSSVGCVDDQSSHKDSPSVGASNDATVGTTKPTDGDKPSARHGRAEAIKTQLDRAREHDKIMRSL